MSFSLGSSQDDDLLRGLLAGGRQGAPLDTGLDPITMALLGVAQGGARAAAAPPGPKGSAGWARALAGAIAGGGQGYMSGMAQERQRGLLEAASKDMSEGEKQTLGLLSPDQRGPALWLRQQQARKDQALSGILGDMGMGGTPPGGTLATPQASPAENRSTVNDPGPASPPARSTMGPAAPAAPVFARVGDRPPPGANPNEHFGRLTQEANAEFGGDEAALARRMAEISAARAGMTNGMPVNVAYRANPGAEAAGRPFQGMPAPDGAVPPIAGQGRLGADPALTNVADRGGAPAGPASSLAAPSAQLLSRAEQADQNATRLEALGDPRAHAMAQGLRQRATQYRAMVEAERVRTERSSERDQDYARSRRDRLEDKQFELQNRNAQTVTLNDGIYTLNPDGSTGRRIGDRPRTRDESGLSFGNGMQGQAAEAILALQDKVRDGSATPQEVARFRTAVDVHTREDIDPLTRAIKPGLPLTPEARAALDALGQRDAAGRDATGAQPTQAGPPARPPVTETSPSGSTREVRPPQITPQAAEASRKMDVEVGRVRDALSAFREALPARGNTGFSAYMGNPRDPSAVRLNTAFSNLTTALRSEAFLNTGVLQPAEIGILNRLLMNPQSAQGLLANREGYEAMLGQIEDFVAKGQQRARQSAGIPDEAPAAGPRTGTGGGSSAPAGGLPALPPGFSVVR